MLKRRLLYPIIFIFSLILIACNSNNQDQLPISGDINLNHGYDLSDIEERMVDYRLSDSYIGFISSDAPLPGPNNGIVYINVYDIESGDKIYSYEESHESFYSSNFDLTDNYLVYLYKESQNGKYYVNRYSFKDEELLSVLVDDQTDLVKSENPIQIYDDYILVNLSSGLNGEGKSYIIDADSMTTSTLLTSYDINYDEGSPSLESIYGGVNRIIDNQIIMSSYNYIDTYNQVDIYDLDDLSLSRSLNVTTSQGDVCDILHAQMIEPYIALNSVCPNDVNKLIIYDLEDESKIINIELPYLTNNFKMKDINDKYILLSDGDYFNQYLLTDGDFIQYNSRVLIYNRATKEIEEVPKSNEDRELSYLHNGTVFVVSNQSVYEYSLEEEAYIMLDNDYDIQIYQSYGLYKNQLIFYGVVENTGCILSYNIDKQEYSLIKKLEPLFWEISYIEIKDLGLLYIYNGLDVSVEIYE